MDDAGAFESLQHLAASGGFVLAGLLTVSLAVAMILLSPTVFMPSMGVVAGWQATAEQRKSYFLVTLTIGAGFMTAGVWLLLQAANALS